MWCVVVPAHPADFVELLLGAVDDEGEEEDGHQDQKEQRQGQSVISLCLNY